MQDFPGFEGAWFMNLERRGRIVVIPKIADAFATISVIGGDSGYFKVPLLGFSEGNELFQYPGFEGGQDGSLFNFPFMFNSDGSPWVEANSFLISCLRDKSFRSRPSDLVRRYADRLLSYALFCEGNGIDWRDFSGLRPSHRPSYRYFHYLFRDSGLSRAVINQSTGVVYRFYQFVSENWLPIDISRVDTVKTVRMFIESDVGIGRNIYLDVRSQTLPVPKGKEAAIGYCLDEGESLRPLTNAELSKLLGALEDPVWSAQERLMFMFGLMTGARKQSILTLRYRHVRLLKKSSIRPDGSYVLKIGPGTGVDTKFGKHQTLFIPRQLAEDLVVFADSKLAKHRRSEFIARRKIESGGVESWDADDVYLFLSEQANCYYMAASDPRYPSIKTLPIGQVTRYLVSKISSCVEPGFPENFSFHWLRATFAYQLYQQLVPLMNAGQLNYVDAVSVIQSRLHHEDRGTTESYLKLFLMIHERLELQELYEQRLFGLSSYADLNLNGAVAI